METNTHVTTDRFVVDLADFPHNELVGTRKDDKYDIEFYAVPDGISVPAMDETTGKLCVAPVKYWSVHRGKQVEIVNLHGGYQIITDDDPRAVYGIATDGTSFDFVRDTPTRAKERGIMVALGTQPLARDKGPCFYSFDTGVVSAERTEHCFELDYDFGQFVGIMAGDGWVDSIGRTWLSDNEGYNQAFIDSLLHPVYPGLGFSARPLHDDTPGRYGNTVKYGLNLGADRYTFADRMKELIDGHGDDTTSGSANKRLPQWYQFAPRKFILGLLNGLVATDGSISVSSAKEKPQLEISFGSTSLRLVREFRRCCTLLGASASICFSKVTLADNLCWLCTVSTVDAKRLHLFDNLCHQRKRDTFLGTSVSDGAAHIRSNCVPFPRGLVAELLKDMSAPRCNAKMRARFSEEEYARRRHQTTVYVNVHQQTDGRIPRSLVNQVYELGEEAAAHNNEIKIIGEECLRTLIKLAEECPGCDREKKTPFDVSQHDVLLEAIDAVADRHEKAGGVSIVKTPKATVRICRTKKFITLAQARSLLAFLESHPARSALQDNWVLKKLKKLADSDLRWTWIDSVEKTGVVETGYDLTVPGYETFMSDEGVILSNTVNYHVPSSDRAVKDALEKMLPSKNLVSLTDMQSARHPVSKEQILGLYALTQPASNKAPVRFGSVEDARRAYREGRIGMNDPIVIG